MKIANLIKILVVLALLALPATHSYAQNKVQLKLITFNIRSFEPNFDVTAYAELLRSQNADIIFLNEVENRSSRQMIGGKYRDVVQDLANELGMFGIFGYSYNLANKPGKFPESNYTYSENELYGNAILSKYPIVNSNSFQLPRPEGSADQRGALTADILLPSMKTARFAVTHLDHLGGQMEQCQELISNKVLDGITPTVLAGDMNMGPGSSVINKLLTKYERMDDDTGTYFGSKIDFILGSTGDWKLLETHVLDRFWTVGNEQIELSDHNPLMSIIEFIK